MIAQHIEHAKRQREAEEHQRQQLTAEWAGRWWRDAKRADPAHPYLVAKGIRPHSLRQRGAYLLAPLYLDGHLVTLQQIAPDGSKRFLSGGRVKGCYSPIGVIADDQPLYVCEGFATGATIHEETGAAVACAMSADNLLAVGKYLRRRYPDAVLIFGGDDDRCKEVEGKPNMGKLAAITQPPSWVAGWCCLSGPQMLRRICPTSMTCANGGRSHDAAIGSASDFP